MRATESTRRLTERELMNLPEDGYRHELLEGFLLAEPRPAWGHGDLQTRFARLLGNHVAAGRLGKVVVESGFVLARDPDTVYGPDVAFVSRDRLAANPPEPSRFFEGAPDLAVEILSPSNRIGEIHAKVADYLAAGARLVWVVDPRERTVTTYRTLLAPNVKKGQDLLSGEDVLPGFEIAAAAIFED